MARQGDAAQPTNHDARNAEEGSFQTHLHTNHPAHFVQREEVRTAAAAAYVASEIPPVMAAATEYPSESRQHEDAGSEGRDACTRHAQRRNAQFAVYQDIIADDVQDVCRYHDVHGRAGVRDAVGKLLEGIEQHDEHQRRELQKVIGADEGQKLGRLPQAVDIEIEDAHDEGQQDAYAAVGNQAVFQQLPDAELVAPPEALPHEWGQPVRESQAKKDGDIEGAVYERSSSQVERVVTPHHDIVRQPHHHDADLPDDDGNADADKFFVMCAVLCNKCPHGCILFLLVQR